MLAPDANDQGFVHAGGRSILSMDAGLYGGNFTTS
jgi:hypothetical protein